MGSSEDKKIILEIADKIKEARLKKNLLQSDVAKQAGLNSNYYAKVERGEAKASGVTLTKIIKALGVKSTDIMPV
ncbi:hypothetical protein A2858_02215 [Candidatus Daviesbacteria bacterium RIFCSPHIGHO2_01_FULL_36_37]|uniref:HTH cro/C1-type domain-containing protein n=1 Tax=Candidatus Daviesbacteria bacterium RIFCSPHIGHO2_01_FULL_36_37 TaxID=1797758 RepID=A0A1F5IJW0_9BACT|nr:MAG: hypothetical protein A2858_02215 [Candidatus Daviesbacteria bacterium RIFCSPHIGHO2_01_FULL_36_37]